MVKIAKCVCQGAGIEPNTVGNYCWLSTLYGHQICKKKNEISAKFNKKSKLM